MTPPRAIARPAQVNIPVTVLEATSSDPAQQRVEGSAIGLWENAWCALDALGVGDVLRAEHLQLNRCARPLTSSR